MAATEAPARRHRWLLALVLAVALGLRLWFGLAEAGPLRYDSIDYLRHGASIAAGHGYPPSIIAARGGPSALRAPGYPYLLGAEFALTADTADAARALNAVLGPLAVLLVYLVAARIWPRRLALTAAALAAVFPPLVGLSASVLSEPMFIALELA